MVIQFFERKQLMKSDTPRKKDNRQRPMANPLKPMLVWFVLGLVILILLAVNESGLSRNSKAISLSELRSAIEEGRIKSLVIEKRSGHIEGRFNVAGQSKDKPARFTSDVTPESAKELEALCYSKDVKYGYRDPSMLKDALAYVLPMVAVALLFYFLIMRQMRGAGGGGILSFGKSRAVRISREKAKKTFDDVAGIDEAREEVQEIISFLRNPEKFQALGGRLPRGVLLIGRPGTGKTLLAKAIAGEADVPFFSISGSDFVEMFVGVGASRVRDLFEQAKANSPCIIFLDEIDAVGRRRANDLPGSGMETAQTLNAILVEMDGFTSDDNVIVVAATNRPDILDPALLRPGRFDRRIYVDLPDIRGREAILKVHTKNVKLDESVDLSVVARGTSTFSGADLENLVNEAALTAVMRDKKTVDMECLEEARDKVHFGKEKRSRLMTDEDRRSTAYHEAGHALLMRFIPHVTPLHKVTIIPRGRALGATMQLPEKDEYSMEKRRLFGEVSVRLGGRAAEELFLDDVTNGAANDFEQATNLVRSMVCEWGMSSKLGLIHYSDRGSMEGGFFEGREFSEATAEKIDDEVRAFMDQCYSQACKILQEHKAEIELLVEALMEFEVLSREEVDLIFDKMSLDELREQRGLASKRRESNDAKSESAPDPDPEPDPAGSRETRDVNGGDAETTPIPEGT